MQVDVGVHGRLAHWSVQGNLLQSGGGVAATLARIQSTEIANAKETAYRHRWRRSLRALVRVVGETPAAGTSDPHCRAEFARHRIRLWGRLFSGRARLPRA